MSDGVTWVWSCSVHGVCGVPVTVEADVQPGLPTFTIVGLTDRAIQEARERVRSALKNSGCELPQRRVTVNLAPAELPKEGTAFDAGIAVAILAHGDRRLEAAGTALLGELALDGRLRPVCGVLPMARALRAGGVRHLVVPEENAAEAALVEGVTVAGAPSLRAVLDHLLGARPLPPARSSADVVPRDRGAVELADIRGQSIAKRALEIAAAGGHNLLMSGPPGTGKTMLAGALGAILPDLDADETLEVASIYSLRGPFGGRALTSTRPPVRAPHHSISRAGLVGGGSGLAHPGEISLAHRGVLFLDELPEFPRSHLEALRQPLEERVITVARARGAVRFPAAISLVAAANPCPCGHIGDPDTACRCSDQDVARYRARLSGPLVDRLDLVVDVPRVEFGALFDEGERTETSATVSLRVAAARGRQLIRNAEIVHLAGAGQASGRGRLTGSAPEVAVSPSTDGARPRLSVIRAGASDEGRPTAPGDPCRDPVPLNANLKVRALLAACRPTSRAMGELARAGERLKLSARAYHRVLRVARTIADLAEADEVDVEAVHEAVNLRGRLRG